MYIFASFSKVRVSIVGGDLGLPVAKTVGSFFLYFFAIISASEITLCQEEEISELSL